MQLFHGLQKKTARLLCDVYWGEEEDVLRVILEEFAKKREAFVKTQGFDFSNWGPEVEFFVFDKVHWDVLTPYKGQSYSIESSESPWSQEGTGYPMGLQGYCQVLHQTLLHHSEMNVWMF